MRGAKPLARRDGPAADRAAADGSPPAHRSTDRRSLLRGGLAGGSALQALICLLPAAAGAPQNAQNIYYLQGFSGHGLALTGLAGRLVAEAIAGYAERFDTFARLKHHAFPGGRLLRTPALVLGMAWYRLRDMLA